MIEEKDLQAIRAIARKYQVTSVLLFGSSLSASCDSRDIDLAIEGLADADYFAFYGDLMRSLSKPVDVVDLSRSSKFVEMIKREGIRLDA
ncbi:MAG: nucleotidyltransferase family protein [Geoalkalibacter sp.]|jgi:predicted nucleotidyltransferase|uniref:nucleotidyltransferase family protein n=1 Tax=Geoalkalibacter sp. TaxID=3041440 RepID=UPI002A9BBC6E|nr:nucleotidyltransferase domain-containing protein [Thermodesulfobacteriota bacterium]